MAEYYLNKNKDSNGCNEIHVNNCKWFGLMKRENIMPLGKGSYKKASLKAYLKGYNPDGCAYCLKEYHKS